MDYTEPLSQEFPNRRLGKKHVLLGVLIGMVCGCFWAISQDGQQVADPTNAMAMDVKPGQSVQSRIPMNFKQPVKPLNFLKPKAGAQPPTSQDKLGMKVGSGIPASLVVAGGLLSPYAAHAGMTPSLQNLLNSVVAGGAVVGAIAIAVVTVSNFDPVDRN